MLNPVAGGVFFLVDYTRVFTQLMRTTTKVRYFRAFHPWQPTANPSMLPQPSDSCPHFTPAVLASALGVAPASLAIKSNPAAACTCSRCARLVLYEGSADEFDKFVLFTVEP